MVVLRTVIRLIAVGGINAALWLIVGIMGFYMFSRPALAVRHTPGAHQEMFGYRQIKPVDTVLVRVMYEGALMLLLAVLVFSGAALFGLDVIPADPLSVLEAFFGMYLLGVGFALSLSVTGEMLPEINKIFRYLMFPLYLSSGVIIPIASLPKVYRDWLMLNPLAHGLEAARLGFAPYYHAVPNVSVAYLYGFAIVLIFFGLALQRRFAEALVTR